MNAIAHTSTDRFTDRLWQASSPIVEAIHGLEFLELLGSGRLSTTDFQFYMYQDTIYLRGYARALALLSARCTDPVIAANWAASAHIAGVEETQLHHGVLPDGPRLLPTSDIEASPVCLGYTSYLVAQAGNAPYPVGAAAILPCFWVYADVASRLANRANGLLRREPDHPYARWIAEYDGDAFQEGVERARDNVDAAALDASPAEREAMVAAFRTATRYEFLFWDSALHRRPWPQFTTEVNS